MAVSLEFKGFLEDQFSEFGPVTIRNMFGGAGIYHAGLMFALIADGNLYFKVDEANQPDFEAEGMTPFTYTGKGRPVVMSYWQIPDALYDDPHHFAEWARKAYDAASRSRKL